MVPLIVLIATFLGAFFGVALVLLRKSMSRGLEGPEAIEQLGLPVYASIPYSALQQEEDSKKVRKDATEKPAYLLATRRRTASRSLAVPAGKGTTSRAEASELMASASP